MLVTLNGLVSSREMANGVQEQVEEVQAHIAKFPGKYDLNSH